MKRTKLSISIGSLLLVVAAAFPMQAVAVDESDNAYELLVVVNRAYGDLIVNGRYQKAIKRIKGQRSLFHVYPYATALNLCAAHSMLGQLEEALPYCDEAVERAEKAAQSPAWNGQSEMTDRWARAYSNRGVLHVMRGELADAEQDFRLALELRSDMDAPTHNVARFHMDTAEPIAATVKH